MTWEEAVAGEPRLLAFEQKIRELVEDAEPGAYLPNFWYRYWGPNPQKATRLRSIGANWKPSHKHESWNPEVDLLNLFMTSTFLRDTPGSSRGVEEHLRSILDPKNEGTKGFEGRLAVYPKPRPPRFERPPREEKSKPARQPVRRTSWTADELMAATFVEPKPRPQRKPVDPLSQLPTTGGVYVVASPDGICKIGMATNIRNRVRTINTHCPFILQVTLVITTDAAAILERTLHSLLSDKRVKGEWFRLGQDDLETIKTTALAAGGTL